MFLEFKKAMKEGAPNFGSQNSARHGFTLIEVLVGAAVFLTITLAIYEAYSSIFSINSVTKFSVDASALANEQLEIVRNLPYSDVGIKNSIPNGVLEHTNSFIRDGVNFYSTTTVRNVDDPFDGTLGGTPNDTSPADYKIVDMEIGCPECRKFSPIKVSTFVSPKNLESASTNGSIFIKVFDANGQPVPQASVHVVNNQANPAITIDDVTNNAGMLQLVDVPPGVNAYEITVSKPGYTTEKTYALGVPSNPNPVNPHATVAVQQLTQISFIIDKVSSLAVSSVTETCAPVPSVGFSLTGSKLVGTSPDILKYPATSFLTSESGLRNISNLEWDAYNIAFTDTVYDLAGANPPLSFNLAPDAVQNIQLIVTPKNPNSLMVSVKDTATKLPVSSAVVRITQGEFSKTLITGQGYLSQTDWSGGFGQDVFTDPKKYSLSDGIETADPAGDITLKKMGENYMTTGTLTSSTFDTGSASNFHNLIWEPQDQPAETGAGSARLQIATNSDGATWNFVGPDGTDSSYYTVSNTNINPIHNGDRYLRYRVYLQTADTAFTPNIGQISFTYTSSCVPPGQVIFSGLGAGTYTVDVSASGYQNLEFTKNVSASSEQAEAVLTP